MTKVITTKFVFKRCEDFARSSDLFKRWINSVDYRKINILQKNNKMCLTEQDKTTSFVKHVDTDKIKN